MQNSCSFPSSVACCCCCCCCCLLCCFSCVLQHLKYVCKFESCCRVGWMLPCYSCTCVRECERCRLSLFLGRFGCLTRWAGVLTKSYCKKLARGGRGNILIIHACCGPQSTYMNLLQTDCLSLHLCVCELDKDKQQKSGGRWDIRGHGTHRGTRFQPLLIIRPWLEGLYVNVDFIHSLGIDLLRPDRCCHRLKGLFLQRGAFYSEQPVADCL